MRYAILASLALALIILRVPASARQALEGNVTLNRTVTGQDALRAAGARLDGIYGKLQNALEGKGPQKLVAAQTAWKKYAAAECGYIADYSPSGLLHPVSYPECLLGLTNDRTQELQNELNWLELLQPGLSNPF
jgi:uncharacterized protein YecT (DUF1311 family)